MSYDDVFDYDDAPEDNCWHEEFDIDILTGRATCPYCHHSWYASDEEIEQQMALEREYAEHVERETAAKEPEQS